MEKEIKTMEEKLENLYLNKVKGAQIRSRVQWLEEGEKNTKFFLGLEKSRQTKKSITALKNKDGKIVTEHSEILNIERSYYENLYKSTSPNLKDIKNYINETNIDHKLSEIESESLGAL